MTTRKELEPLIISEWLKRPERKRTGHHVLAFYLDVENRLPHLLSFRSPAKKSDLFYTILRHHITPT